MRNNHHCIIICLTFISPKLAIREVCLDSTIVDNIRAGEKNLKEAEEVKNGRGRKKNIEVQ